MTYAGISPLIVKRTGGIYDAVIIEGDYKGLPLSLAVTIASGKLTKEEVQRRGWRYEY